MWRKLQGVSVFQFAFVQIVYKDLCSLPPPFMHQDFIPVCDAWGVSMCVCVWVGGCVCVCVGKDLIFTDGDLSVDKISPQWIIPKTIPGSQSQVWPENTGLRIHQDLVVNISGLSQGHNEVLVTWYQAAFEFLMFWLLKKLVHLLIMFINFWWIVCLHLCLIFKALLKIFITTLYILSIWAPWQNFAIFFPSLALVFH